MKKIEAFCAAIRDVVSKLSKSASLRAIAKSAAIIWKFGCSSWKWVGKNEAQIVAITAVVMIWTLSQNQKAIRQNAQTLQTSVESLELQRISTLHPELECAFDPYNKAFVMRNAGAAPATNIYLKTTVVGVTSNQVLFFQAPKLGGSGFYPLHPKLGLSPGEQANANERFVPDVEMLAKIWMQFGDDVLIRVYVEYESPTPIYHRYSGHFNYVFSLSGHRFVSEEEQPSIRDIVNRYNTTPRAQHLVALFSGGNATNQWQVVSSRLGFNNGGPMVFSPKSNGISIIRGAWTKHN